VDKRVIPVLRRIVIARVVGCAVFVVFGVVAALPGLIPPHRQFVAWFGEAKAPGVSIAFWLAMGALLVVMFGVHLFWWVRILRSPGLRLTGSGFEFGGWNWRWADVGDIEPVIGGFPNRAITHARVMTVPGNPVGRGAKASVVLGKIGFRGPPVYVPVAFDTGDRNLDSVLRARLQSYRGS
jgi:hypothetical protein